MPIEGIASHKQNVTLVGANVFLAPHSNEPFALPSHIPYGQNCLEKLLSDWLLHSRLQRQLNVTNLSCQLPRAAIDKLGINSSPSPAEAVHLPQSL